MKTKKTIGSAMTAMAFVIAVMTSCADKYKNSATPDISFSKDINPVLTANCSINSSCHAGAYNAGDDLNFDVDAAYNTIISKQLVKPTDPTASLLYVEINSGMMPKSPYSPLRSEQVTVILNWIKQGARNN